MNYIRTVLQAGWIIDYNLRKQGKKTLVTLSFIRQWRFHLKLRSVIERHFAWAKRYFGLEAVRWKGLCAADQHTALLYSVMLGVALAAHRFQRPDLAGSRMKVLAIHARLNGSGYLGGLLLSPQGQSCKKAHEFIHFCLNYQILSNS